MKFYLVVFCAAGLWSSGHLEDLDSDGFHLRSVDEEDDDLGANPETEQRNLHSSQQINICPIPPLPGILTHLQIPESAWISPAGQYIATTINFTLLECQDSNYWQLKASVELDKQLAKTQITRRAKNVIIFLGDGMSVPTLAAARFYAAELENARISEGDFLSFEQFPFTGLSKTYCVDSQVADSACSATAYLSGVKSNKGTIGVNGRVKRGDCLASLDAANRVDSIALSAQRAGKATGIVTNTRVTHASPAGTYAHVADRNWESDYDVQNDGRNSSACDDIARQLILRDPGRNFNVIMGGGRRNFIPKVELDPIEKKHGYRVDNVNLVNEWKRDKTERKKIYSYVTTKQELSGLVETPDYLLGRLFAYGHMDDHADGNLLQPTLEQMTEQAIKVLQKNKKGYFLFVEGGRIDMAHHSSNAHVSLDETLEFSKAIAKAVQLTDEKNTLIVVTSDHAHTMSFSGYAKRSNSIFGFGGTGTDKIPYTILNYANGPGYNFEPKGRKDISKDNTKAMDYVFPSGVPLHSETHGGDDVGVFARGPFSHIFSGSYEQNYIPYAAAFAANLTLRSQDFTN